MEKIKGIATNLIQKYNTSNIYELCDYLNITIKKDKLGSIKGYFLNIYNDIFITLNENLEEWEEPIVLAHELGHILLHTEANICFLRKYTFYIKDKYENEANEFAAHILITDDELKEFKYGYECVTIEQLSKHFKVPKELVLYKLSCK